MSRTRTTTVVLDPVRLVTMTRTDFTGSGTATTTTPYTKNTELGTRVVTMTDVVTPNFLSRIARGDIINSPMTKTVVEFRPPKPRAYHWRHTWQGGAPSKPSGNFYGHWYDGTWVLSSEALGDFLGPTSEMKSALNGLVAEVVTSAHAKTNSSEMDVLATLGEGNKTIASIATILARAFKIFRAVKRLDIKYLRRQISRRELEDRYMELRYAIRPLMYDAYGLANALSKTRNSSGKKHRKRFSAKKTYAGAYSDEQVSRQIWTVTEGADWHIKREYSIQHEVSCGILADISLSPMSIFGVTNLAEAAWELTPWSFIIDWFLNIGDLVRAWSPDLGVRELASWTVVRTKTVQSNSLVGITVDKCTHPNNGVLRQSFGGTKTLTIESVVRSPNPDLVLHPSVNVRLDTLKLADLAIIMKRKLT